MTVGGRLFQALVPVAEKDRSPSVDLRVAGTTNADELEDLRRCCDSNCETCCNCSERYAGARLCLHLHHDTEFVLDSLLDTQPVEVHQYWCDMF